MYTTPATSLSLLSFHIISSPKPKPLAETRAHRRAVFEQRSLLTLCAFNWGLIQYNYVSGKVGSPDVHYTVLHQVRMFFNN